MACLCYGNADGIIMWIQCQTIHKQASLLEFQEFQFFLIINEGHNAWEVKRPQPWSSRILWSMVKEKY